MNYIFAFIAISMSIFVNGKAVIEEVYKPQLIPQPILNESEYGSWFSKAQTTLKKHISKKADLRKAKNIILFLGDGMSVATVSAARILQGQKAGTSGEGNKLFFEEFPYTGFSKTYCVDKQVGDSACTATAYLSGIKANLGTIGVTGAVRMNDCNASTKKRNQIPSISVWAQKEGKSTGVVTTTMVTHASPAGTYAHIANRGWESDYDIKKNGMDPKICKDIAYQLINTEPGMNHKVILGGGRKNFLPKNVTDEDNKNGIRLDGKDLIKEWKKDKKERGFTHAYVTNKDDLFKTDKVDYLLGLFNNDHLNYHLDVNGTKEPSLSEMTKAAIKQLSTNKKGYFLFVEGGKIDFGHHDNLAYKALDETIEFSEAVKTAYYMASPDTLIVVTADHSHTMTFSGYPDRGNNILGLAGVGLDKLPYSTLSYANGPSYKPEVKGRHNLTKKIQNGTNYMFSSSVPLDMEAHGGEDVQVFASGPWAHLFTGAYEQNVIPHMMAYASCIGPGLTVCS